MFQNSHKRDKTCKRVQAAPQHLTPIYETGSQFELVPPTWSDGGFQGVFSSLSNIIILQALAVSHQVKCGAAFIHKSLLSVVLAYCCLWSPSCSSYSFTTSKCSASMSALFMYIFTALSPDVDLWHLTCNIVNQFISCFLVPKFYFTCIAVAFLMDLIQNKISNYPRNM